MSWIVLRRASENTWELCGPSVPELDHDEADDCARQCADLFPHQAYAVAQIQTIYSSERTVTARPVAEPNKLRKVG